MKIIGHRGAAGLKTENTVESIKKAIELGVDGVEFDVWTSKDGVPVLLHNSSVVLPDGRREQVFNLTLKEIKSVSLPGNCQIPTLAEAVAACAKKPIILDVKDFYLSKGLLRAVSDLGNRDVTVSSFNHHVLAELQKKARHLKIFATTNFHPLHTVRFAARNGFDGVAMDWKVFSLPVYWYARRRKLELLLFTVNSNSFMKFLKRFNIQVGITTNFPDRAKKLFNN